MVKLFYIGKHKKKSLSTNLYSFVLLLWSPINETEIGLYGLRDSRALNEKDYIQISIKIVIDFLENSQIGVELG